MIRTGPVPFGLDRPVLEFQGCFRGPIQRVILWFDLERTASGSHCGCQRMWGTSSWVLGRWTGPRVVGWRGSGRVVEGGVTERGVWGEAICDTSGSVGKGGWTGGGSCGPHRFGVEPVRGDQQSQRRRRMKWTWENVPLIFYLPEIEDENPERLGVHKNHFKFLIIILYIHRFRVHSIPFQLFRFGFI